MRRLALFVALVSLPAFAGSPQWFRDLARVQIPTYSDDTRGVVLLDEQITSVSDSGEVKTTYRMAYKILRAHGRNLGTVTIPFDSETKISNLHAWSLPPSGNEYELKDKDALETAMFGDSYYSDDRTKILTLPSEPGSIVGYEYEQKQRPQVFMDTWSYQRDIPVLTTRYTLNLPAGWEMENFWVNHPKAGPSRSGNNFTWEEQNIAAIKPEDNMPSRRAVAPRMEVAFFPGGGKSSKAHTSWSDVGDWYYRLSNDRRQPTPDVQAATQKLLAGKTAFLDKARTLAAFAQRDVRYVAIEIGIGGYQPHDAASILANHYGDCKDKVTLMSAMLKSAGIDSDYIAVHTDRGVVSKEAPTMRSFNHVIIGIHVPKSEKLPDSFQAKLEHPKLGTLLIFDPTDELVPLGYLPSYTQSNYGLLVQEKGSELVPLPAPAPESSGIVRTGKLALAADGRLTGEVREVRTGVQAAIKRYELLHLQALQRRKAFENFLSSFLTGFSLKDFSIENLNEYDKDLVVTYSFDASDYSKKMGPLMIVRPRVFGTKAEALDFRKERKFPFELNSASLQTDRFDITLPDGYTVDELPPPTEVKNDSLRYQSATSFEGKTLTYKRTYKVEGVTFPADRIGDLKTFYSAVMADERNSAVLKKQ
jgi:hypothetical protein